MQRFERVSEALSRSREDGMLELCSPGVGFWRDAPQPGHLLGPGEPIGRLEALGSCRALEVPADAGGVVVEAHAGGRARAPVGYGELLLVLAPRGSVEVTAAPEVDPRADPDAPTLLFEAPMSGRFYSRPAAEKAPFVAVGQEIAHGQTIGLLEVMKTFNRLVYAGPDLPPRARITAIVPADGADLSRGDPILELAIP